ncbi:hypothetical protein PDJ96_07060 [Bacillus cereus group sp. BY17LC]|uniref:hypothetical protein n=1 Tax=Bacillus cereus group sp. BY17LC TaxID=3018082 RepID=UPI0022E29E38|nr:hypothetical protein [Bacillus cereus group sp. BY17LC]MDA1836487.1 hypothetical protein [Bacillus cereus group sp. BY17LC]
MFLGYIEIPKHETRYLDMPTEQKAELMRNKRRRRRRKKHEGKDEVKGGEEKAENETLNCEKLHSQAKKNKKDSTKDRIEIEWNGGATLHNWDYVANDYKTN